jgi:thiol-disulfide isomerase/thioredoxin
MKYFVLLAFMFLFSIQIRAQKVAIFANYSDMEKTVLSDENTTYVVNFWATWCAPCVQELPYFEQLNSENSKVKIVLVSLDFKDQYESKLLPFLKKKSIKSDVVMLTDKDYNTWLPKVDIDWSGSIPATLIINKEGNVFAERVFSNYEELNQYINTNIN